MTQRTYARVQSGDVVELFRTAADIKKLFHEKLLWIEVSDPAVRVGWIQVGQAFVPPPTPAGVANAAAHQPNLAELQAQLAALGAQIAALQATAPH